MGSLGSSLSSWLTLVTISAVYQSWDKVQHLCILPILVCDTAMDGWHRWKELVDRSRAHVDSPSDTDLRQRYNDQRAGLLWIRHQIALVEERCALNLAICQLRLARRSVMRKPPRGEKKSCQNGRSWLTRNNRSQRALLVLICWQYRLFVYGLRLFTGPRFANRVYECLPMPDLSIWTKPSINCTRDLPCNTD